MNLNELEQEEIIYQGGLEQISGITTVYKFINTEQEIMPSIPVELESELKHLFDVNNK